MCHIWRQCVRALGAHWAGLSWLRCVGALPALRRVRRAGTASTHTLNTHASSNHTVHLVWSWSPVWSLSDISNTHQVDSTTLYLLCWFIEHTQLDKVLSLAAFPASTYSNQAHRIKAMSYRSTTTSKDAQLHIGIDGLRSARLVIRKSTCAGIAFGLASCL